MAKKRTKPSNQDVVKPDTGVIIKMLDITLIPIDSVQPNEYNPNRQSDHEFELLCRSIEEDGFTQPILVNKDNMRIVDGEHRWRACKALGHTEIPACITTMDEIQAKIATLRHNRARGSEDIQRAADVFRELDKMGATDWAKDSLIVGDVETAMMLNMVTKHELNMRTGNMSYDDTQITLEQEKQLAQLKKDEVKLMEETDAKKYTIQFTFMADEALVVKAVVGREHAAGVLTLCNTAIKEGWV